MSGPDRTRESQTPVPDVEQDLARANAELQKLTRRLAVETAERRRLEETLRALRRQILSAQDTERRRIGRELHDGVNQLLASIKFRLLHVESQIREQSPHAAETISQSRQLVERAVNEVRRISNNLRPTELDDFGLAAAAEGLIQDFRQHTKIHVDFNRSPALKRVPIDVELALYRILQEALANIQQHSSAQNVVVTLVTDADFATLNIRDDGRGFDGQKPSEPDRGLGIVNMRERAHALGGVFSIRSNAGSGTEISVHVKVRT